MCVGMVSVLILEVWEVRNEGSGMFEWGESWRGGEERSCWNWRFREGRKGRKSGRERKCE